MTTMTTDHRHFGDELALLKQRLLVMGGLAEERVHAAIRGLEEREGGRLREVIEGDARLNTMQVEIDDRCFKLLALHQPMAIDLRTIVAAVKINADLERVGDLAVNIAQAAAEYIKHPPVKPLIDLPRMARIAERMLRQALDAFVGPDLRLARSVLGQDDELDDLKHQVFRELLTYLMRDPGTMEAALDLLLISRHLERVGDHATNIAEDVIFIVEAKDVRHQGIGS
jgi:phosphate transport system protein